MPGINNIFIQSEAFKDLLEKTNIKLKCAEDRERKVFDYLLSTRDEPEFAVSWTLTWEEFFDFGIEPLVVKFSAAMAQIKSWRDNAETHRHL